VLPDPAKLGLLAGQAHYVVDRPAGRWA